MQILAVSLTNFKTHRDQSFTFLPGTNAICGENGAGKTSILEAIAWVLFNYKGTYKVEDLIRNGAASAQVCITLISSADDRTYDVQRCTQKGYQIYDPQLQTRLDLSRIEEDVLPWLRQHLGVAPDTDLARLFGNTVGVPQGTFTVDFLKSASERKKTFDATLKVEAYRQVYEGLASLEKYAKAEVEKLEQAIAQYEEALAAWEPLQARHQDLQQEIQQLIEEEEQGQAQLQALAQERQQLSGRAAQIQALTAQEAALKMQLQTQKQLSDRWTQDLQQAAEALKTCHSQESGYHQFLASDTALRQLEQQRRQQQELLEQRQTLREQVGQQQTQLEALQQQQARLTSLAAAIEQLAPDLRQLEQLEQQQQELGQRLQACQHSRQMLKVEQRRLAQLEARLAAIQTEIETIQQLKETVEQIPILEDQQQRCQQQLSRMEAAQQFEAELRQLLESTQIQAQEHHLQVQQAHKTLEELQAALPLYTESLHQIQAALATGTHLHQQLEQALTVILADLAAQTSRPTLIQQLQQVEAQLQTARSHQVQVLRIESLVSDQRQLRHDIQECQAACRQAQAAVAQEPELQAQQAQLSTQLAALQDPRGRLRLYQQELQQSSHLEQQDQQAALRLQQAQQALQALESELTPFTNLDSQIQAYQSQREAARPAYQTYLEHQQLASRHPAIRTEQQQALEQQSFLEAELRSLQQALEPAIAGYDLEHHRQVETAYKQAEMAQISRQARRPEMEKRLQDVEAQQAQLQRVASHCEQARLDLARRIQIQQFVTLGRKAYKQAGPRITERYVQQISREADRLFRELLNRPNVSLEWTRDYDIVVQEGAHPRRFVNLSGGEQMCAALAVRLALLKVLAAIDIAFFDEPTTNMDRPRREQLAEAIANIKSFRQLFVISHDDTFEKVTGHVVLVERCDA